MFGSRTDKSPHRPGRDSLQLVTAAGRRDRRHALTVAQEMTHLHQSPQEVMHSHRMFGLVHGSDEILAYNGAWKSIYRDGRDDASWGSGYWDDDLEAQAWAWHDREFAHELAEVDFGHELDLLELMGAKEHSPREALQHDTADVYGGFVDFPWHIDRGFAWRS